jgi:hypothetical protein
MAVSMQIGPAMSSERIVTHTELMIKGRNPNSPERGFHWLEKIN